MAENIQELVPPPSIGESKTTQQPIERGQKAKGSKIWIVVLLCVVLGVGIGIAVYQKSMVPAVKTPSPTPVAVVTPKPAVVKTPVPTPQTQLPTVPVSTESASLLDASPMASESAAPAEINLVNPGVGTGSATPSASLKASPTASASARVTMPEGDELPEAGIFELTVGTVGVGMMLVLLGILGLLVL